jgi:hypothetical protein
MHQNGTAAMQRGRSWCGVSHHQGRIPLTIKGRAGPQPSDCAPPNVAESFTVYPNQFYGQPLVITLDSNKAADAGSSYNVTICAEILKKN